MYCIVHVIIYQHPFRKNLTSSSYYFVTYFVSQWKCRFISKFNIIMKTLFSNWTWSFAVHIYLICKDKKQFFNHMYLVTPYHTSEHLWFRNGQIASKLNVVVGCIQHTQAKITQDQSLEAEYNLATVEQ